MSRAVPDVPQFLLSVTTERGPADNAHVHIGYTCHPHSAGAANCFTVGFYGNDLDVTPPAIDVGGHHEWEHWCTTLLCPQPQEGRADGDEQQQASHLARRRLYRNGELLAEDECVAPHIDQQHTLLLGRYAPHIFSSLHGGLCDVRLYSRALAAAEVQALYAGEEERGSSSVEALEVWYKLDATSFDERLVRDSSGHGRDAAVEGALLQLSVTGGCNATQPT